MDEIQVGQHNYVIGKLDAFAQFHVSRRIAPVIPTILPLLQEFHKPAVQSALEKAKSNESVDFSELSGLGPALLPFADALAQMSDENSEYVIKTCLSVVKRVTSGGSSAVARNNVIMFDDIDLGSMLPLVIAVLRGSLGNFIRGLLTKEIQEAQPE